MDVRYGWVDPGEIDGSGLRGTWCKCAHITEGLVHSGSKQVRPMDVRSGWADPGQIDGSGLRAMWCKCAHNHGRARAQWQQASETHGHEVRVG